MVSDAHGSISSGPVSDMGAGAMRIAGGRTVNAEDIAKPDTPFADLIVEAFSAMVVSAAVVALQGGEGLARP